MKTQNRIYALDVLKFVAAVCIIFHHYQAQNGIQFSSFNFNGGKFYFGYLVELFFIISGFLTYSHISRIPEQEGFGSFFKARCIRLLPINAITAATHCVVIQLLFDNFHIWGWIVTSFGLFALGESFTVYNVNAPAWYVSVLLLCYIWFYFLTYWGKRKQIPLHWLFAIMSFAGFLVISCGYSFPLFNGYTGRGYFAFFIGVLLKQFVDRYGSSRKVIWAALAVVVGFVLLLVFGYEHVAERCNYMLTLFVYPSVVILCNSNLSRKIFRFRWLGVLGEVSFGMYLWHTPVFQIMGYLNSALSLGLPYSSWKFMLLVTVSIIALSFVSLYCIEKPISRIFLRRQKLSDIKQEASAS